MLRGQQADAVLLVLAHLDVNCVGQRVDWQVTELDLRGPRLNIDLVVDQHVQEHLLLLLNCLFLVNLLHISPNLHS